MSDMRFSSRERIRGVLSEHFMPAAQRENGLIDRIMHVVDFVATQYPNGVLLVDENKLFGVLKAMIPYISAKIMRILNEHQMLLDSDNDNDDETLEPPDVA